MHKLKEALFKTEGNAPLVVFRIFFGFLLTWQAVELVLNGWVKRNLTDPKFTFSHIGMDWLQPLPGNSMYWYFGIMAVCGILIMAGSFYRYAMACYTLLWAGVYWNCNSILEVFLCPFL